MLVISKPYRKKYEPDYNMLYNNWSIDVFPHQLTYRDARFTSYDLKGTIPGKDVGELYYIPHIYHILESKGSPSVSMLYMEYMDRFHYHQRICDMIDTDIKGVISRLIHFTIWEPDKIKWCF